MEAQDKAGRFVRIGDSFGITDEEGNPLEAIEAGVSLVTGPFRLVLKEQIAHVTGVVTASMVNAANKTGDVVYEFQGNGWRPQAKVGDILLQDVENPADRWACGTELFGGTGWVGMEQEDGSIIYVKPGKPLLALEIPEGTLVKSREGNRPAPAGCLLAVTNADKGDFYLWTADVVQRYVKEYVE